MYMITKVLEKARALELRKEGRTYKDIAKELHVAKSSLSLWLRDLPLTEEEIKYLKVRKDANISRGRIKAATILHNKRLGRDKILFAQAKQEFSVFIKDPLFSLGIALYWAEGSKRTSGFTFTNSDPDMFVLMVNWIEQFLKIPRITLTARLYTHRPFENDNNEFFWSQITGIPLTNFRRTIYKKTGLIVKKRPNYKGCLRVATRNSTVNLRKVLFWQSLLKKHCRTKIIHAPVAQRIERLASDEKVGGSSPSGRTM